MAISLFWIGAPYLLMGFSHDYWLLLTCAALVGIGNNLWHPTAIPLLAQHFPDRKGLAVSIHGMGGNVGDAVAPLVAGMLLTYLTWREVAVMTPLVVLTILFGFYPAPILDASSASVDALMTSPAVTPSITPGLPALPIAAMRPSRMPTSALRIRREYWPRGRLPRSASWRREPATSTSIQRVMSTSMPRAYSPWAAAIS